MEDLKPKEQGDAKKIVEPEPKQQDDAKEMEVETKGTEQPPHEKKQIELGGSNYTDGQPAYALLTGIWRDNEEDSISKGQEVVVNIPITSLPIVLGRKWGSTAKDPHHFSLPNDEKQLCRLHACIFYRDEKGGKLGCYEIVSGDDGSTTATEKVMYKPYEANDVEDDPFDPNSILRLPGMKQTDPLPKNGFFAIECLGRHTIKVGGKRVTKGKQAMLKDGIPIQIASYCFYFLLPKDTPPISQKFEYQVKKSSIKKQVTPKPKAKEEVKEPPAKKPKKTDDSYMSRLDNISTQELLTKLKTATESEDWSKDDQLCSSTLGMRIAREAAKDVKIQKIAREQHGVTQRDIIDWYKAHTLFSDFERLMLSKIEYKSYQSGITKAIQRAGFTRNESNPGKSRYTRWDLPPDVPLLQLPLSPPRSPRAQSKTPKKSEETKKGTDTKKSAEKIKIPEDALMIPRDIASKPSLNDVLKKESVAKAPESKESVAEPELKPSSTVDTEDIPLSEFEKAQPPPKP